MSDSLTCIGKIRQFCRHWLTSLFAPDRLLQKRYSNFRRILQLDGEALDMLADLESHLLGQNPADPFRIKALCEQAIELVGSMADELQMLHPFVYRQLLTRHRALSSDLIERVRPSSWQSRSPYTLDLQKAADYPGLVGGKARNLSLAAKAGVKIPKGFVITINAFHRFIKENRLEDAIASRLQLVHAEAHETIIRITEELQELILAADVPADVVKEIEAGLESLSPFQLLALRSSALAEDGQVSFAGQYASELNVPIEEVLSSYKMVLAGKYCPRAVSYRIRHGLSDSDTAMAVLVVPMIVPYASGVVYSLDPAICHAGECLGIYAVAGLAEGLVDGSRTPQKYYLPRNEGDASQQGKFHIENQLLSPPQLSRLKTWALQLEAYFGCTQDIEWALDDSGLTILQCRRLQQKKDPPPALVEADDMANLLFSDLHCASAGISCGPVFPAPTGRAFRAIPAGSVVLTGTLRPALSQFTDRIAGVIAQSGSRASHFASVARERGIPVLVGEGVELDAGRVVTVDAASGRIFSGCVSSILQGSRHIPNKDFPRHKYADLADRTTHLSLTDPESETFTPGHCCSLHDIVRFCHEKSVQEMFHMPGTRGRGMGKARKLVTDLPLSLYILDLEGGLDGRAGSTIGPEEITSLPMRACWRGLSDPRIHWDSSEHNINWEDFDRMSGGIFSLGSRLLASYAIVSSEYMHLSIRFGYHFSVVDALCGKNAGSNYVKFRFNGGGALEEQILFRLQFIDQVLSFWAFETSYRSRVLEAAFCRGSLVATETALVRLGMVLAVTRRMDVRLTSEKQARDEAEKFIRLAESGNAP